MTKWPVQKHTEHHKTQSIPQAYIQLEGVLSHNGEEKPRINL